MSESESHYKSGKSSKDRTYGSSSYRNGDRKDDRASAWQERRNEPYRGGYDRTSRDRYFGQVPKNGSTSSGNPPRGPSSLVKSSQSTKSSSFSDLNNTPKGPKSMSYGAKPSPLQQKSYGSSRTYIPAKKQPFKVSFLKASRDSTIYERVVQVGEGTYGKVYKAKNIVTGAFVALKRLRMESEREGFPITAMREIRLLQSFNHPNVVPLLEIMVENKQIYMIFDYADHDLTGILSNPDLTLTDGNRKFFFRQLCEGLNYLHIKKVIHRDIKGSNLLIDKKGVLKIADFGLARKLRNVKSYDYTNRVITLWYRPPELLLGTTDYGREVDIWGIGCLLVELYTKRAIFQAQDEIQQLFSIFEVMGTPNFEQWPQITDLPWYEVMKPSKYFPSKFQELYGRILSPKCYDLATKMLLYDPSKRITSKDALKHDFFTEEPLEEPLREGTLNGEWHEFEAKKKRRKEREERKQEEKKKKQRIDKEEGKGEDSVERKENSIEGKDSTAEPPTLQN
ncbi:hypothetical protein WICMUC_000690 [Wickerhamomyces mucosus]|uniref:Protein kinase domain-containing protein n=1 Tax=Wickerhamomyces mucosus TaxID=1378264 RepID=A0A9P8PYI6_9ASCO|nr:hypothetical protein WICMUC_000690 [Wickerhamomyces mucosus]